MKRILGNWRLSLAVMLSCVVLWAQAPVAQGPQATNAAAWLMNLSQVGGAALALGQTTMSASVPVAIASNQSALPVSFSPSTSSSVALTRYHSSSGAAANVKASAGNLYGIVAGNSGTVPCWLQVFNTAGTPTAGTSVVDSYMVQAGVTVVIPPGGLALTNYATGIALAGATADSGATTTGCTTTFSVTAYYQ